MDFFVHSEGNLPQQLKGNSLMKKSENENIY